MSSYITNPHIQFLDEDGKPLAYGTVETYIAGTTNEYATMKDFNGTMNPSKIVLDDDGSCCIILPNDQLIKMIIRTREGRLFKTYDNVGAGAGGSGAGGGDYYGSDFIAIDQIARVISLKNYKYITTDNTLVMDEDPTKITLKVNPSIIDVNKTIEGKAGINVEENEDKIVLSLDGNNIDITSDSIEVSSEYDEDTGVKTFNLECDIPEPIDAYTKSECNELFATKSEIPDISNLATKDEIPDISNLAKKSEIPDISDLASFDYVDTKVETFKDLLEGKIDLKQDKLVSGNNISTINGQSLLSGGDIEINGSDYTSPQKTSLIDNTNHTIEQTRYAIDYFNRINWVSDGGQFPAKNGYNSSWDALPSRYIGFLVPEDVRKIGTKIVCKRGSESYEKDFTNCKYETIGNSSGYLLSFTLPEDWVGKLVYHIYYGENSSSNITCFSSDGTKSFVKEKQPLAWNEPTQNSLKDKQDILVSGVNVKTINGQSIVGSGDLSVSGSLSPSNVKVNKTITLPGGNVSDGVFDTDYSIPANKTFIGQVVINALPATSSELIRLGVLVGNYECWYADGFMRATSRYTAWALPFSYSNGDTANNVRVRIEGNLPEGDVSVTISGVLI